MIDVVKLYPQYNIKSDRRQQNNQAPVTFERRQSTDRRSEDRIKLDTNLTRDIFEIKSKVSQIQNPVNKSDTNLSNSKLDKTKFTSTASNAALNSIKTDQFVKTTKSVVSNTQKYKSDTSALAGVFAAMIGGVLAAPLIGIAGVGLAIGIGAYFGGKFLKSAIVAHIKNK